MKKLILHLILIAFAIRNKQTFAQHQKIDSLSQVLKTAKEDTNQVNILNSLAMELRNNNPDTAIYFAKKALALSEIIVFNKGIAEAYLWSGCAMNNIGKTDEALISLSKALSKSPNKSITARIYNNIGIAYNSQGKYPEALKNHFSSLEIMKKLNNKTGIATSYNNIGNVYKNLGKYPEALKSYFDCLKIMEELDNKMGAAASLGNVGEIYRLQGNLSEALKSQLEGLKIAKQIENKIILTNAYNNIGLIYFGQGNFPEALKSYLFALKIREEINDKEGIAAAYNNIGGVYSRQGNYNEALKNHFASLKIKEEIGDKAGISFSYLNIGDAYYDLKNYKEAELYSAKALSLAKNISLLEIVKTTNELLCRICIATNRHKQALEYYKAYIIAKDSLNNEEHVKKTIRMQMNYDFEKKEQASKLEQERKDAIVLQEKQKQKVVRNSLICGFAFVLLLALLILKGYRNKQKANLIITEQKEEVEKAKSIIEEQKQNIEEKQKEILDSIYYAKRIQTALIASEKYIEKSLTRLSNK